MFSLPGLAATPESRLVTPFRAPKRLHRGRRTSTSKATSSPTARAACTSPRIFAGIEGKTFLFGARSSTSGRVMPEYFIRNHFAGKTPEKIFSRFGFSGDHSRTLQLVQSGA